MREYHIAKELEGSIEQLLPVHGLEMVVEHGRFEQADLCVRAKYQKERFDLIIEVVPSSSLSAFREKINHLKSSVQGGHSIPVLAAPYFSPERQALCREAGVCFMDLSGNVLIAHQSIYVERIGFPNKYPEKRHRRYPFSDKASLILRELLKNPQRQWGIRELAGTIGLDPGYVSRMAKSLSESGYASRAGRKLNIRSPEQILDDWASLGAKENYPAFANQNGPIHITSAHPHLS